VQPFELQGAAAFDDAFARMAKGRAEAVMLLEDAMFATERAACRTCGKDGIAGGLRVPRAGPVLRA
jgi:hypothetical protein